MITISLYEYKHNQSNTFSHRNSNIRSNRYYTSIDRLGLRWRVTDDWCAHIFHWKCISDARRFRWARSKKILDLTYLCNAQPMELTFVAFVFWRFIHSASSYSSFFSIRSNLRPHPHDITSHPTAYSLHHRTIYSVDIHIVHRSGLSYSYSTVLIPFGSVQRIFVEGILFLFQLGP